jgi:signal transduction histidine kinase
MLLVTGSLFWRRRAPLAVAAVVAGGLLAQTIVTGTFTQAAPVALCQGVALYSLGAYTTARRALVGAALIGLEIQLKSVIAEPTQTDDSPFVALFWWLLVLTLVGLGMLVRSRRRAGDLQRDAAALEAGRAEHARAAVDEERRRIARELHDVVSHNVSATILQAEAAEELLKTQPERAGAALHSIQSMGREALGEMRRMLGIIRADNGGSPAAPQPRLSDLPALVERVRATGLPVELSIEGPVCDVAPGIELSAYRIVQEALTNVRKHAGDANAQVGLRYSETELEVQIDDDGDGVAAADDGTGHGLIGMRERVEFFGGDFSAGRRARRGFRVTARFPIATGER